MPGTSPPRRRRALGASTALFVTLLAGCASYERSQLDLPAHRTALALRLEQAEPLDAFVDRLAARDTSTPEHFDPADGLSVREGEALALFYNPDLRLARLETGVDLATLEHAGAWDDPVLAFDGAEILSPAGVFQFGLSLGVTIPISGRLGVEKDRAGAVYQAGLARVIDAEWSTLADLRRAWAAWSTADERVRLLHDANAQIEQVASVTDRLEAAGELPRVESRLFRVELADQRAALAAARLDAHRARLHALALMGLPPDTNAELIPALNDTSNPSPADPTARLIEANTALAVQRAEYHTAEETLRLEVRKQYPDITLSTGYGSEDKDDRLLLGLSLPIPSLNANRGPIAEARAQRELARAHAETTYERLARKLADAQATLRSVRDQRTRYESEIVPMLAEQSAEIARIAELGEVNTLLLLETVTRQSQAKSRLLDLRLAETVASITIAELLGPNTPASPAPVEHDAHDPDPDITAPTAAGGDR